MSTSFDQVIYFGDSLTDNQNLSDLGDLVLRPIITDLLSGPTGAVSDGPTHVTYTLGQSGLVVQNYAVASAETDGPQTLRDLIFEFGLAPGLIVPPTDPLLDFDINLDAQVDRFLLDNGAADLSSSAAFIWIGANDYNRIDLADPNVIDLITAELTAVIASITDQVVDLSAAGVNHIYVATLPAPEFFAGSAALAPDELSLASAVFDIHNAALDDMVNQLSGLGIGVEVFDVRAITDTISEDPTSYGLIAPYEMTQTGSDVLDNFDADQVAFYDANHPTTAVHGVIGAFNALAFAGVAIAEGSAGDDLHWLTTSDDFASGLAGNDRIWAREGNDVLAGGSGSDFLAGQGGADVLIGGSDDDHLRGGADQDILSGGFGDDLMFGGTSDDLLVDSLGSDTVLGCRGNDTFIFAEAELIGGSTGQDQDQFFGGLGDDQLIIVLSSDSYATWADVLESGAPNSALDALGITTQGIESYVVVEERTGLSVFAGEVWFDTADIWGLI